MWKKKDLQLVRPKDERCRRSVSESWRKLSLTGKGKWRGPKVVVSWTKRSMPLTTTHLRCLWLCLDVTYAHLPIRRPQAARNTHSNKTADASASASAALTPTPSAVPCILILPVHTLQHSAFLSAITRPTSIYLSTTLFLNSTSPPPNFHLASSLESLTSALFGAATPSSISFEPLLTPSYPPHSRRYGTFQSNACCRSRHGYGSRCFWWRYESSR